MTQNRVRTFTAGGVGLVVVLAASLAVAGNWGDSQGGAYLGVVVNEVSTENVATLKLNGPQGALVQSLDQDGPACRAGLKANDVIMAVDGKPVQGTQQLAEMMHNMSGGKVANITVLRDGRQQDIKVTLGSRQQWMTSIPHPPAPNTMVAGPAVAPVPPVAFPADIEVPLYTPSAARRGLVVESMTAQLGEYFGAPRGQGVLVRNVQKGSTAANAGLKAGDVIVKINGEAIRDLADWRRSMTSLKGKATVSVIRDKRTQTVEMTVPGPISRLHLEIGDLGDFSQNIEDLGEQMALLGPELQRNTQLAMLNRDEYEKMQRDLDKSVQKQMKHQAKEIEKSMKHLEPQMKKQAAEIQKQMDQMRPELNQQMESARKQMEQIGPEFQKQMAEMQKNFTLRQEDLDRMRHEVQESMKDLTPQLQQQMDEMRKQMEQWKSDWPYSVERPNQF
jgi:serine protease Do